MRQIVEGTALKQHETSVFFFFSYYTLLNTGAKHSCEASGTVLNYTMVWNMSLYVTTQLLPLLRIQIYKNFTFCHLSSATQ